MSSDPVDEIWDDLFHGCAWTAFVEEARLCGRWPGVEATRRRAYALYETALRETYHPVHLRQGDTQEVPPAHVDEKVTESG